MIKKGSNKLISVYWFIILILVAGGIVMMANVFYSSPYDIRSTEANIISTKVANCIYFGGKMNPALIGVNGVFKQEFKDNFLSHCNLNFDSDISFTQKQYYTQADFYLFSEIQPQKSFELSAGNKNWIADCGIKTSKPKLPVCYNNSFLARGPTGKIYLIKTLSIVGNVDKNVQ